MAATSTSALSVGAPSLEISEPANAQIVLMELLPKNSRLRLGDIRC